MDKRMLVNTLVSAIGGALIGGAITYVTVKKTIEERAQRDIDEVKQAYAEKFDGKRVVEDRIPPVEDISQENPINLISDEERRQVNEFVKSLGYQTVAETTDSKESVIDIYTQSSEPPKGVREVENKLLLNYDEQARRAKHLPYLISHVDFHETETEWSKISLAYYEDDDTLAGDDDLPIDDIERLIGEVHLDFFGIRSDDKNIVYIRNPQLSSDFEITRNAAGYNQVVLGLEKDADKLGILRMREGDDG